MAQSDLDIAISMLTRHAEPLAGIGRHVEGLVLGLACYGFTGHVHIFATEGVNLPNWALPEEQITVHRYHPVAGSALLCLLWHLAVLPRRARKVGAAVLHVANLKPTVSSRVGPAVVLSLHDVAEALVRRRYDVRRRIYRVAVLYPLARRHARIVAVSESARADISHALRIPAERIAVIPNVIDLTRFRAELSQDHVAELRIRYSLNRPYFLSVGRLEHPNKNLLTLMRAFRSLRHEVPQFELVLAGPQSLRSDVILRDLEADDCQGHIRYLGPVSEADLPALYRGARATVVPSLYEGFGLTALEAMACGTPVVASTGGALPEVVGDAGLLFDPQDAEALQATLKDVATDDVLAADLADRGRRRTSYYDPVRAGKILDSFYRRVAAHGCG
jgi:glycosyltransferase involved in cell wall biosynthesis